MIRHLIPLSTEVHSEPWARCFGPYGVAGEFSLAKMRFKIRYYIGDKPEPLNVTVEGLRKLRKNPDVLATLLHFGSAVIQHKRARYSTGRTFYFFIADEPETENGVYAEVADGVANIFLPPYARWKEVGLDWLLNYCPCCKAGRDDLLPWIRPFCDHAERLALSFTFLQRQS